MSLVAGRNKQGIQQIKVEANKPERKARVIFEEGSRFNSLNIRFVVR